MDSSANAVKSKIPRFKSIDEFNILDVLGRGGYSVVHLVENKKTGRKYALKCAARYKKGKDRSERTYTEIKVLEKLKHPNIISLKGHFEDSETIYLVLEYISGKDCSKFFKHNLPTKLQIKSVMRQLVESIIYIHKQGIVHRDIKLENILIDKHFNIRLTDFGLCAIKETEFDIMHETLGTLRYTAPELIKGDGYNDSVDIWGIGIVFFMLLTGEYPFNGSSKTSIFKRIQEKRIHYSQYNFDKKEINLLKLLLKKDPEERIEIEDILNDPFFQ
jgi:serine/threonine protein kinase